MTVRVTFEFTHTEDGIDVKSDVVPVAEGCCACEVAFAATAVASVKEVAGAVRQALKADPASYRVASDGSVH